MRYSFRSQVYQEPLPSSLERLRRFGYDAVEILGEPDRQEIAELRQMLDYYGLRISHVNGDFSPGRGRDLCSGDAGVRRDTVEYCKRCISLAHEIGAGSVEVRPSPEGKTAPTASLEQEWRWAVEALEELGSFSAPLGVKVAIEPANRYEVYLVNTIDDALRLIQEVGAGNLGILADCFHMNIEEAEIGHALQRAGGTLVNVHIADSNRQPPGRGHTDFLAIVRTLKEIGYTGYLTFEPVPVRGEAPSSDQLDRYYAESIQLMRLYELLCGEAR
jgi:sugar phosphate isomerase/epimerase